MVTGMMFASKLVQKHRNTIISLFTCTADRYDSLSGIIPWGENPSCLYYKWLWHPGTLLFVHKLYPKFHWYRPPLVQNGCIPYHQSTAPLHRYMDLIKWICVISLGFSHIQTIWTFSPWQTSYECVQYDLGKEWLQLVKLSSTPVHQKLLKWITPAPSWWLRL